jgi:hypothetical protein
MVIIVVNPKHPQKHHHQNWWIIVIIAVMKKKTPGPNPKHPQTPIYTWIRLLAAAADIADTTSYNCNAVVIADTGSSNITATCRHPDTVTAVYIRTGSDFVAMTWSQIAKGSHFME